MPTSVNTNHSTRSQHTRPPHRFMMSWWLAISLASTLAAQPPTDPLFADRTTSSGVAFTHISGATGAYYIVEEMGPGAALFDYDKDGDLDLYLVQGGPLGPGMQSGDVPMDRLYRNDGLVRFTDVSATSGIEARGYGIGVAVGDIDGDGYPDIYLLNYGPNQMLRNSGNGRFSDITSDAGTGHAGFSISASFFDYDGDGDLDLFVANYVTFTYSNHRVCRLPGGQPDYCGPKTYPDAADLLYRNRGDGTFEDVTAKAGINVAASGLGVVAGDLDGDNLIDLYVANDADPNLLWRNQGGGRFTEDALFSGCALNSDGRPEAGMGVAIADDDGDGDLDLFVTHITGETHTLYRNQGGGLFEDRTIPAGLGAASIEATGFGTAFIDYDNDGQRDLLVVNGNVQTNEAQLAAGDPHPLHQPNQLFHNQGGSYREVTHKAPALLASHVSRGAAFGDLDNDGDTDVVIANNNGPTRILENLVGATSAWLGISAKYPNGRFAVGARIALSRQGQPPLWYHVARDGSYASASDPRALFGLGGNNRPVEVRIYWPDGSSETWSDLATRHYHSLIKGTGQPHGKP